MSDVKNTDFGIEPEYTNPAMKNYEVDGQIDIFAFIDKNDHTNTKCCTKKSHSVWSVI